ncbi:hypothetical protein CDIK_2388 [Cucumispora dikerogammari]|nr:hypothetical protein CDIK_2388 [Cucumispora dikerogammari]
MPLSPLYLKLYLSKSTTLPINKYKYIELQNTLKSSILTKHPTIIITNLAINLNSINNKTKETLTFKNQKSLFLMNFIKSQHLIDYYIYTLKQYKNITPFLIKVNKNLVPLYYDIIKLPIDLSRIYKDFTINFSRSTNTINNNTNNINNNTNNINNNISYLKSSSKYTITKDNINTFNELFYTVDPIKEISHWLNLITNYDSSLNSDNLIFDPWNNKLNPKWNLCVTSFKWLLNQMCENYLTFNLPTSDIKLMGDDVIENIYKLMGKVEVEILSGLLSEDFNFRLLLPDRDISDLQSNLLPDTDNISNISNTESNLFPNKLDSNLLPENLNQKIFKYKNFKYKNFKSRFTAPVFSNNNKIPDYLSSDTFKYIYKIPIKPEIKPTYYNYYNYYNIKNNFCFQIYKQKTNIKCENYKRILKLNVLKSVVLNKLKTNKFNVVSISGFNMLIEAIDYLILKDIRKLGYLKGK